jgi:hypothetical protein
VRRVAELESFGDSVSKSFPDIVCAHCGKILARAEPERGPHVPTPEVLLTSGAVPVPNFGWFCGQDCATRFEQAKGRRMFDRNSAGDVEYYPKP